MIWIFEGQAKRRRKTKNQNELGSLQVRSGWSVLVIKGTHSILINLTNLIQLNTLGLIFLFLFWDNCIGLIFLFLWADKMSWILNCFLKLGVQVEISTQVTTTKFSKFDHFPEKSQLLGLFHQSISIRAQPFSKLLKLGPFYNVVLIMLFVFFENTCIKKYMEIRVMLFKN